MRRVLVFHLATLFESRFVFFLPVRSSRADAITAGRVENGCGALELEEKCCNSDISIK